MENHVFKITNQDQNTNDVSKQKWRKTPAQIQRDLERQQTYHEKKKVANEEFSDVPLVNEDKSNNQAHKVIHTATSTSLKDVGINTDKNMENNTGEQNNSEDHDNNLQLLLTIFTRQKLLKPSDPKSNKEFKCKICGEIIQKDKSLLLKHALSKHS